MNGPRKGPLTRRETPRGGRRAIDSALDEDTAARDRPVVVLAEDDRSALEGLAEWLAGEGFKVLACPTFGEAKAQLATRRVAALLTDIRLAEFNGLHLVQLALTLHPRARLVVFSGHSDDVLQAEAQAVGALWLLKPLDLGAVSRHLADLLPRAHESSAGSAG
jgi:two-component system, response regulator RegA